MNRPWTILFALFCLPRLGIALTLSSSGVELSYEYEAEFRTLTPAKQLERQGAREAAYFHAKHLFGLFHAPEVASEVSARAGVPYPAELIEGFAGTKMPHITSFEFFTKDEDPLGWVKYTAQGTMVVFRPVAQEWLSGGRSATVKLPLLVDLPAVYQSSGEDPYRDPNYARRNLKMCTDEHYYSASDFSYFYDPYRKECEYLRKAPIAKPTEFKVTRTTSVRDESALAPLTELVGENKNGRLVTLYFLNGYDSAEDARSSRRARAQDAGWQTFKEVEKLALSHGFTQMKSLGNFRETIGEELLNKFPKGLDVVLEHEDQGRYFSTFVKKQGKKFYVIRNGLMDTSNEDGSPLVTFPKYWEEAMEKGDFLYFGGHSGDGQAFRLSTLMDKLGRIYGGEDGFPLQIPQGKQQVFLFDTCSAYSHFLDKYRGWNRNGHIITVGLVSLFQMAGATVAKMLDLIMAADSVKADPKWIDVLRGIEESQLEAHVLAFTDKSQQEAKLKEYRSRHLAPSSLMSVSIPE